MYPEIDARRDTLQDLFEQVKKLQDEGSIGDDMVGHLVWYLCIRTSGYIESSIQDILLKYVQSRTRDLPTQRFVESNLKRVSADYDGIMALVRRFNEDWRMRLRGDKIQDYKPALDNLVENRNHIAHGRSSNITLQELQGYFADSQQVIALLYNACVPKNGRAGSAPS